MSWDLYLRIPVEPKPKRSPLVLKTGRTVPDKRSHKAMLEQIEYLKVGMHDEEMFTGPLEVECIFAIKRPKSVSKKKRPYPLVRPDVDNYQKMTFDAATRAGVWEDDSLVCAVRAVKIYTDGDPFIDLKIRPFRGLSQIEQPIVVDENELPQDDDVLH